MWWLMNEPPGPPSDQGKEEANGDAGHLCVLGTPIPNIPNTAITESAEHTKNKRPSTQGKHEAGQARKGQDYGGEKGDTKRDWPRKRPEGWRGSYPPKE